MALGTNYARGSLKADLLTIIGLEHLKRGKSRAEVSEILKPLRRKRIEEIKLVLAELRP